MNMRTLVSLEAYNRSRQICTGPRLNGIACPKCGAELADSDPNVVLTSLPPQMRVHCSSCDYRGYRVE